MPKRLRHLFWYDGLAGLVAGITVLASRHVLAKLYDAPLELITVVGVVNLAYSPFGIVLALKSHRPVHVIASLAAANFAWAIVCIFIAIHFNAQMNTLGQILILAEGAFVTLLGSLEWRYRHGLVLREPDVDGTPSSG